jgi:hypothetical protein
MLARRGKAFIFAFRRVAFCWIAHSGDIFLPRKLKGGQPILMVKAALLRKLTTPTLP